MPEQTQQKDEYRIQWLYNNEPVGQSPLVWQKEATAHRNAENYLEVMRIDYGIDIPVTYQILKRNYVIERDNWL